MTKVCGKFSATLQAAKHFSTVQFPLARLRRGTGDTSIASTFVSCFCIRRLSGKNTSGPHTILVVTGWTGASEGGGTKVGKLMGDSLGLGVALGVGA